MGEIVLPTASSGIAAANIPGGRTTHSQFKIPLECDISLACDVPKQSSLAALIRAASLIIWDEASMSKRQNIESLDHLLRDLCDSNLIFGGKVVVFGGDFRQTLPILPRKSQQEIVEASLFSSHLWPKLIKFSLTENLRAKDDPEFAQFLLALGNGELQTKEYESIELPAGIVRVLDCANTNPIGELAAVTFPELAQGTFDTNLFTNRAILTPLNDDVDAINDALIEQFPGQAVTYTSYDSMLDDTCSVYPAEFINKLNPGGMSPHKLVLKVNCPVILIRNLQPSFGLCNGTRLICKRFCQTPLNVLS
ncbi:ATP-dependent DNA helicase pfh1-like [Silene latifolia]|uniref:ATP-dependent DNA helicase pfh1-like n=1 Tax=Silene latifolia TaxID=37657 RepID=UPI003D786155